MPHHERSTSSSTVLVPTRRSAQSSGSRPRRGSAYRGDVGPGPSSGWPVTSGHGRLRAGCRWAPPARDQRGPCPTRLRRPCLGRWKVTVTSARTTGSDGSPLLRSSAVGVSTARTGTRCSRARMATSTAVRTGSRSGPRTPRAQQRVDDEPGTLDAVEVEAPRRWPGGGHAIARSSTPSRRSQLSERVRRRRAGRRWRAARPRSRRRPGQVSRGHEPIAAVVAGAAEDEQPRCVERSAEIEQGPRDGRHGHAGLLHQPVARASPGAARGRRHRASPPPSWRPAQPAACHRAARASTSVSGAKSDSSATGSARPVEGSATGRLS